MALSPGVKWPQHAERSPPHSTEVKNEWSCTCIKWTSAIAYPLMWLCHATDTAAVHFMCDMSKTKLLGPAKFKVWWYASKHFLLLFLEHKVHSLQDLMFLHWCCWRFKSSEMLGHVDWHTVATVSEDHNAFIFRDEQSKKRNDLPVNITYPRTQWTFKTNAVAKSIQHFGIRSYHCWVFVFRGEGSHKLLQSSWLCEGCVVCPWHPFVAVIALYI